VGAGSTTDSVRVAWVLPPVLVAVTTYGAAAARTVGVPVIAPVPVSRDSPAGSAGVTR